MAPRPSWKGYLKLSLVSCPVALYPATTTSGRVRFNIINRRTGHRIHNMVVDAETREPVEEEDRVKGVRSDGGDYLLLEDEELDQVALESTHTMDIEAFVPLDEVERIYLDESYYVAPTDKATVEAFAVVREAMREENLVGLARVVLYRRERLLMLEPRDNGLVATLLRYRTEVRDPAPYFAEIPPVKIPADMLDLAIHILESKKTHFEPSKFEDRYETAVNRLIKAKRAGKALPTAPAPPAANVVNLMEALRRSVETERSRSKPSQRPASPTPAGRRPTARRGRIKRAS
jgi:DNA end-binding protein Ku